MSRARAEAATTPGNLDLLTDDGARDRLLREAGLRLDHSERTHARVKPGAGGLVGLVLHGHDARGEEVTLRGYLRTGEPARMADLAAKWQRLAPVSTVFGAGVRVLPDGCSLLFLFPNDAALRRLRDFTDIDKLKRRLAALPGFGDAGWRVRGRRSRVEIVRYKPEQRLIARLELTLRRDADGAGATRSLFLRVFPEARGLRLHEAASALAAGGFADFMPRPVGCLEGGRVFVEERVEAHPLLDDTGALCSAAAPCVALIRRLQGVATAPLPCVSARDRLERARETAAFLASAGEEIAARARALVSQLASRVPEVAHPVTIHGDLHLHQLLVGEAGPILVDFERCARGHRLEDPATLAAHARLLAQKSEAGRERLLAFADDVEAAFGAGAEDRAALRWFMAAALLEMALLPHRRREPDAAASILPVLQLATELAPDGAAAEAAAAGGALRWHVLYPGRRTPWACLVEESGGAIRPGIYQPETGALEVVAPERDAALPALAAWCDRAALRSHRPGRRATLETSPADGRRFIKVVRPRRAAALVRRLEDVSRALSPVRDHLRHPSLLEADTEAGVLVFDALPGVSLHEILREDSAARREAALARLAPALVALQGVRVASDSLPPIDPLAALPDAIGRTADFGREVSVHRELAAAIAARRRTAPRSECLVHGDLHDKNLLDDADRVAILDWDGAGRGDPHTDLGNLLAHVQLRCRQRGEESAEAQRLVSCLIEAFRSAGGEINAPDLGREAAATTLRLACLYDLRRPWRHLVPGLLDDTRQWLDFVA